MTQEEKAKRFDEALERAKIWKNESGMPKYKQGILDDIFPELKESYDERVRKWLMEMVEELRKANPTNADHNGMCSEALFWLEKQYKQNPAWSEEDERMYKGLHNLIYSTPYCDSRKEFSNWLKSLKDRVDCKVNCTSKKERSEEDEKTINELCNIIAANAKNGYLGGYYAPNLVEKIKSLRPRNTWKPSDEYMEALNVAKDRNDKIGFVLGELYEQLKALKGG